jgi:hypothetical protein
VRRLPLLALAVSLALMVSIAAEAPAAGPGGWDHLADGGTPGTPSLNGTVAAFNTDSPGVLLGKTLKAGQSYLALARR